MVDNVVVSSDVNDSVLKLVILEINEEDEDDADDFDDKQNKGRTCQLWTCFLITETCDGAITLMDVVTN